MIDQKLLLYVQPSDNIFCRLYRPVTQKWKGGLTKNGINKFDNIYIFFYDFPQLAMRGENEESLSSLLYTLQGETL